MVPDNASLRQEYAASLRLQTAQRHPDAECELTKADYILARKFQRRARIDRILQTRRVHSTLAGTVLWDLQTAVTAHPDVASKNKVEFAIDRISIANERLGTKATLQDAWRRFRPVIHWCAAAAYQWQVFGSPFPKDLASRYIGRIVLLDFLSLGEIFLSFACKHVEAPKGRPHFWTAPTSPAVTPRHSGWPDAHTLTPGIELRAEFIETILRGYVVETNRLARDPLISGQGRRAKIAKLKISY